MKFPAVSIVAPIVCAAVLASATQVHAQTRYRAVSLTLWGGGGGAADEHPLTLANLDLAQLDASLASMQAVGVDTVGVNVFWLQDTVSSNQISPDPTGATGFAGTATTGVAEAVIDAIHARGMKVMLKPLVNLRNDPSHWRGQIAGSDSWFWGSSGSAHDGTQAIGADDARDGYANFIYHWADVAQAHNVEVFCVGTELASASGGTANAARWRAAVGSDGGDGVGGAGTGIRNRYDGTLTYAAQHGGTSKATQANIQWWDEMDLLGVDAYYPLTGTNDPTQEQLDSAWAAHAAMLEAWSQTHGGKDVLFTEVGYASFDGTNKTPWALPGSNPADLQEQAACYEALLSTLWDEEWWGGAFWWNWEIDPDPSDWNHAPVWFTPQGKPAADVLAAYYVPEPASLGLLVAGLLTLRRRRRR